MRTTRRTLAAFLFSLVITLPLPAVATAAGPRERAAGTFASGAATAPGRQARAQLASAGAGASVVGDRTERDEGLIDPRRSRRATADSPVATSDATYQVCGRVFPDPHAYWPAPTPGPNRSPWAKGNAACQATDFLQYEEMISGLRYLETVFPRFVQFYRLERDFANNTPCATSTSNLDFCSAGLPRQGVPNQRVRFDLYMARVTDERVPETNKKYFVFPLSLHGIERAGAEAGVRAIEDLATWGFCEAQRKGELSTSRPVDCAREGDMPHPLMEAQPEGSITAGAALKQTSIYFVFLNADGWKRGDRDNIARFFQRYNGNGVDLNRDWPTQGYTFRPYTPWSEPESRAFGKVLKSIRKKWAGGIDLHGQLIDRAFSFTLLGAGEHDYTKNQRILQTVKGAWRDAEKRLAWNSALIKPNDAPDQCSSSDPGEPCDERMYGVQWGTVWDTIAYTITGGIGDWINSPIGLDGDGIDNEMSLSHLINCGVGSCWIPDAEQLHVDGNKSLIYSMVNFTLKPEDTTFRVPGTVAYIHDPRVVSHPGSTTKAPPSLLPPQRPILDRTLSPANDYTFQFQVLGPRQGVSNGGLEGKATTTNVQGISADATYSLVLERLEKGEPPIGEDGGCGAANDDWGEVNRYFNQGLALAPYAQAGMAVHSNLPLPGTYRICFVSPEGAPVVTGPIDLDITFTREKAWEDPGQLPYRVTNMKFFTDLARHMRPGQLTRVLVQDVLSGRVNLDRFTSVVLADNPMPLPGATVAQGRTWYAKLKAFANNGGNLVLTDAAFAALPRMGLVPPDAIDPPKRVYAGYISFSKDGGRTDTYADPLARNIDQPGAAEGPDHRHQTYEPVPIGYAIQDANGDDLETAPQWTVDQPDWVARGGRVVGQGPEGGVPHVSLGEMKVGKGRVRIIGALLPMPTNRYYHPFGLANYAVTYTGYQLLNNLLHWTRPA